MFEARNKLNWDSYLTFNEHKIKNVRVSYFFKQESLFFDAEVAMEGNVCRDLASSIQQEELIYLQQIAELLLFLLMPKVSSKIRHFLTDTSGLILTELKHKGSFKNNTCLVYFRPQTTLCDVC